MGCIVCDKHKIEQDVKKLEDAKKRAKIWGQANKVETLGIYKTVNGYGFKPIDDPYLQRKGIVDRVRSSYKP